MSIKREDLYDDFADGKIPTGSQFHALIESIVSRNDDGLDKIANSALKVAAGNDHHAPVLSLGSNGSMDPTWTFSLNANSADGLNIGQGSNPETPVLFLDRLSGNIGVGTPTPSAELEVKGAINDGVSTRITNSSQENAAFVALRLNTHTSEGILYRNGSQRVGAGGPNTMTLKNDVGDIRLLSESENAGIYLSTATSSVGINKSAPENTLDVAGDIGLNGNSIFFTPNNSNVGALDERGLYWQGKQYNEAISDYGIYRTPGPWSPGAYQQLRLQFNTGIQLAASGGYDRGFVEIVNGKGLMVSSGKLGVGTDQPKGKIDLVGGAMMLNANLNLNSTRPGVGKTRIEGEIAGYSSADAEGDDGFLRLSAGGGNSNFHKSFIDLTGNSNVEDMKQNIRFGTAGIERLRVDKAGKVGLGTSSPATKLNIAGSGMLINGQGLLLGDIGDPLKTDALLGEETGRFEIGFAGWRDAEPNQIGAKISAIRIADYSVTNPYFIQATELAFTTSTGNTGPGNNALHETGAERLRIDKYGRVGIGTSSPQELLTLHLNTDGEVGQAIANSGGGVDSYTILKLRPGGGEGIIFKNSPARVADGGVDTMTIRNNQGDLRLQAGAGAIWLKGNSNRVGIGTDDPMDVLEVKGDVNGQHGTMIRNVNAGSSAYTILRLQNGGGNEGILFRNSPNRSVDGGKNTMTIRNGNGDLRLQGGNGASVIALKQNGSVGVGTELPEGMMQVRKDQNSTSAFLITNTNSGSNAAAEIAIGDGTNNGYLFKNSASKTSDGGMHTMTLRNDGGDLRLQSRGGKGIRVKQDSGNVGIGTESPKTPLNIGEHGTLLNGKGILLGEIGNPIVSSGSYRDELARFEIGNAGWRDVEPNQVGAKIAFVRVSNHNSRNGHFIQASELAFSTSTGSTGVGGSSLRDLSAERMRINLNGYIGIGTNDPQEFVDVFRDRNASCAMNIRNPNAGLGAYAITRWYNDKTQAKIYLNSSTRTADGGKNNMTVRNDGGDVRIQAGHPNNDGAIWLQKDTGHVGLGTSDPKFPLHITKGTSGYIPNYYYMNHVATGPYTGVTTGVSIWASNRVVASEFNAISDRRVKTSIQKSSSADDLSRFQTLQFSDYKFKDFVGQGNENQKGLIAQEVQTVFPEAVHQQVDFIPNIYAVPKSIRQEETTLTVEMEKAHGLINGDILRLMVGSDQIEKEVEVLDAHKFLVKEWAGQSTEIFVFGKRVNDFMVVDYNKVFCLGMSATQEMNKTIQQLKKENESLASQMQAIRKHLGLGNTIFEA